MPKYLPQNFYKVRQEFDNRLFHCMKNNGNHFENFLWMGKICFRNNIRNKHDSTVFLFWEKFLKCYCTRRTPNDSEVRQTRWVTLILPNKRVLDGSAKLIIFDSNISNTEEHWKAFTKSFPTIERYILLTSKKVTE